MKHKNIYHVYISVIAPINLKARERKQAESVQAAGTNMKLDL